MTGSDRPRYPRGRTGPAVRATSIVAVLLGSALTLAGCSGSSSAPVAVPQTSTTPASLATTPPTENDQVLTSYRAFWAHLTAASRAPAGARQAILAKYAADPELSSLLRGMAQGDRNGTVFYGQDIPRPRVVSLSSQQGLAVIRDCQNSSRAGNADRKTGRRLTVGVSRHLVISTMNRVDGQWRVASVSYKTSRC